MMAAGGPDKRKYGGVTEKVRGVQRGWKWRQKTGRLRHALEDDNDDGNKADKGYMEVAENGGIETATLRVR